MEIIYVFVDFDEEQGNINSYSDVLKVENATIVPRKGEFIFFIKRILENCINEDFRNTKTSKELMLKYIDNYFVVDSVFWSAKNIDFVVIGIKKCTDDNKLYNYILSIE